MTNKGKVIFILFFLTFLVHSLSPVRISGDSRWTIPTALSIIFTGDTNLDEYYDLITYNEFYGIEKINGHYYSYFPVGASIISVPFVIVSEQIIPSTMALYPNLEKSIRKKQNEALQDNSSEKRNYFLNREIDSLALYPQIEIIISSFLVSITTVIIFLISIKELKLKFALLNSILFAFATTIWSNVSRAMYSHSPSILLITISLYILISDRNSLKDSLYLGFVLFSTLFFRPTNFLFVFLISIYLLLNRRRYFVSFLLVGSLPLFLLIIYNFTFYSNLLTPYYHPERVGQTKEFFNAFWATLISPSRGLFFSTPVLMFALVGLYLKIKAHEITNLDVYLLLFVFFTHLVISSFPHWWGGYSIGPRLHSDILPILFYFLIPFYVRYNKQKMSKVLFLFFILSASISFIFHFRGAFFNEVYFWNYSPTSIDKTPSRVWDFKDIQFLR